MDSLALFVRAAELNSLTKAASASNISLAAASRRITLLEDRFRTSLFKRSTRGVELTPAGVALLENAKTLLTQINKMRAEMSDYAIGRKGALRVLASTSAMSQLLPSDLAAFTAIHPDVRLVVGERWSSEIVRAVSSAETDLGIIVEGVANPGLEVFPYRTDRIAVVIPSNHELASRDKVGFLEVLDHVVVGLESDSAMMRLLSQRAAISERTLELRIEVRSFDAVCRMVQSGMGIGFLPEFAALTLSKGMQVSVRPLSEDWAVRRMQVCLRRDHAANRACKLLADHLSSVTAHVG